MDIAALAQAFASQWVELRSRARRTAVMSLEWTDAKDRLAAAHLLRDWSRFCERHGMQLVRDLSGDIIGWTCGTGGAFAPIVAT